MPPDHSTAIVFGLIVALCLCMGGTFYYVSWLHNRVEDYVDALWDERDDILDKLDAERVRNSTTYAGLDHVHPHEHPHDHPHDHEHDHPHEHEFVAHDHPHDHGYGGVGRNRETGEIAMHHIHRFEVMEHDGKWRCSVCAIEKQD